MQPWRKMSVVGGIVRSMTETLERHETGTWVATPPAPSSVLDAAAEAVSNLDDVLWAARPPAELLRTMRSVAQLRSALDAVEARLVAEIDATQAAKTDGWASTKDFVTAVSGGHKGAGRRTVALAKALTTDREATAQALAAGLISREQAEVIVAAVDRLPVDPGLRDAAEGLLLGEALDHDATDLARRGRYVADRLDPDGADRRDEKALEREERAAHRSRFLAIVEDGIGGVRLKGRGTVEDAAWLKSVLLPLAAPRTTEPSACGATSGQRPGECGVTDCAHDGRDPREHGARMWDALVDAARLLAGTDIAPESHGAKPRITVTVEHQALVDGVAAGQVVDVGGSLSAGAVRRLACDAEILPMVLGSRSQILDVGRTSRLVTLGLWLALVARDRHCAFPGCTRPPVTCDAHHVTHWADGGGTSLDNLVLLCRQHHTTLHTTPWAVRINPDDGRPDFLPPPRAGGDSHALRRRPLRE
jgi:hypothetical protein